MTSAKQATVEPRVKPLGHGFIRKMRTVRSQIHEMKTVAEGHGRCCPPCEIPALADYLEGVEKQLEWYLHQLHETQRAEK